MEIRHAEPGDHARVAAVIDDWWGGRRMRDMLPRLFFTHFRDTSFVAEDGTGGIAGFLCGFLSQTYADQAYVHFVGVAPAKRGAGLARALYERFFDAARAAGRSSVHCVTSPVNTGSIAFHEARLRGRGRGRRVRRFGREPFPSPPGALGEALAKHGPCRARSPRASPGAVLTR